MHDLLGEHQHVHARIRLFQQEHVDTPAPERRRQLVDEMLHAARESAELARRIEAARLLALLRGRAADTLGVRYAFEVPLLDRRVGLRIAAYTDGPRAPDGAVLTVGTLRGKGDPVRACVAALARQLRELDQGRSERRRNLIEAHGRETAQAIRREMEAFFGELTAQAGIET